MILEIFDGEEYYYPDLNNVENYQKTIKVEDLRKITFDVTKYHYTFTTKDNHIYHVVFEELENSEKIKTGRLDFELIGLPKPKDSGYIGTPTTYGKEIKLHSKNRYTIEGGNDVIKVFNTIAYIVKSHIDDLNYLIFSTTIPNRLSFYRKLISRLGYTDIEDRENSLIIKL